MSFTVISYCTEDFAFFADHLESDCEMFGYPFHCRKLQHRFQNVIHAFDYKIGFIQDAIQTFGTVLWLDVECRIIRDVPPTWSAPLITDYRIGSQHGLSSGVLMLGEEQLPWLKVWKKYAGKYPKYPDDFILDFLMHNLAWPIKTIEMSFYDQASDAVVSRGEWSRPETIIAHPSTNRWPDPSRYRRAFGGRRAIKSDRSRQRKHIFYRNYSGDFDEVDDIMRQAQGPVEMNEWVFDGLCGVYSPLAYWPKMADNYFSKPRSLEASARAFFTRPKGGGYRDKVIKRMKLDINDRIKS